MGFLLGPKLASIFIVKVIPAFKNKLLYLRYVDDCFVLVRSKKVMDKFYNICNNA